MYTLYSFGKCTIYISLLDLRIGEKYHIIILIIISLYLVSDYFRASDNKNMMMKRLNESAMHQI